MKFRLFALVSALAVPHVASAMDAAAERQRMAAERRQADARFVQEEKACRANFAVMDCVAEARARQRETLAAIRRQELTLNEMERKRKAADKLREIDERHSPARQQEEARQRAIAVEEQKRREAEHAEKVARRQAELAAAPNTAASADRKPRRATPDVPQAKAQANRLAYEKRLAEAEAHRAKAAQRAAQKKKPAASGLPVPP